MAKRRRESDSDGASPATASEYNPVFVDTSLDTHLAMLVSNSDTVSDFKEKTALEHMKCFPKFGEIKINSLKVKRRGNYYNLPDFMLVCSVFNGVKGNWFLSADASSTLTCYLKQNSLEQGTSDCPEIDVRDTSDVNRLPLTLMSLPNGGGTDKNGDSEMTVGLNAEKSLNKTVDFRSNYNSVENCMEAKSPAKKKRKMRHNDDVYHSSKMEPEVVGSGNSMVVDAVKEAPEGLLEVSGVGNDQPDNGDMVAFEGTVVKAAAEKSDIGGVNSENLLASDNGKEGNLEVGKSVNGLGQNDRTRYPEAVTHNDSNLSDKVTDNSGSVEDAKSDVKSIKKKKAKKAATKVQDSSYMERKTRKGVSSEGTVAPAAEEMSNLGGILENQHPLISDQRKEDTILEGVIPDNSMAGKSENELGQNVPTDYLKVVIVKEPNLSTDVIGSSGEMQYAKSDGNIKRKKAKRTAAKVQDTSNMEHETRRDETNEETSVPAAAEKSILNSQILLASDKREEDTVLESVIPEFKTENELGQDIPPQNVEGLTVKESNLSAGLLDTSGTMEDAKSDGIKKKKKKSRKTAAKVQDLTSMEHETGKGKSEKMEEDNQLSQNQDLDMMLSSYNKTLDRVDPDSSIKETSSLPNLLGANVFIEPIISNDSRKKKKKKKVKRSADTNMENLVQTNNFVSGSSDLIHSSTDRNPEETGKTESTLYHTDKDVSNKLLNNDAADASEKVRIANEDETDHQNLTQTEQTLEDAGTGKAKIRKKNQSIGNSNADFPVLEKENQVMEFSLTDKHSEITGNREKKDKKKRKKSQITASCVQENLLIKDDKVDTEVTTKEISTSVVNSEQNLGHVASSLVFPDKSEEKHEVNGSVVNTDVQGINFEQYFVHSRSHDEVGSDNKVKEATESNDAMKTKKKVKKPFVSNSTELQNSLKSNDEESGTDSRVKSAIGRRDSALNSDQNPVLSNSINKSLAVSRNGSKSSIPREMQKHNEVVPSNIKEKKSSLAKSSLERSTTFLKNKGDKKFHPEGKNFFKIPGSIFQDNSYESSGTHKTVFKTPQKKSLLTKLGSIFQDNSGEDSGDKFGTVDSDATTCSPSDSSSQSGHSEGESDTSQNSTRNGLTEGERRSSLSNLNLSASKDMTTDMILRSSKQFKKAKKRVASSQSELVASQSEPEQNESQQIDFVPETEEQPNV